MKLRSRLATLGAIATLGLAGVGHAAVVTVEQSLELTNPRWDSSTTSAPPGRRTADPILRSSSQKPFVS